MPTVRAVRAVGPGASAGGLEALQRFLAEVPAGSGLTFLLVRHLDPTQRAMLAPLLQRVCKLPVRAAPDGRPIAPDRVYVIPPNAALTLSRGSLHREMPTQPR